MRTFRHARLLAATGAALATLALTACDSGTGTEDEGAAKPTATRPSQTGSESGPEPQQTTEPNGTTEPAAPADSGNGDKPAASSTEPVICNGSNTKVTAQTVSRPLNHMLLTVTNTGSKPCSLMYYPVLRFDEMQWAPQARPESKPQAVPTLAPVSGYSGVLLSAADGSGDGGMTAKKLTVMFQGRTPSSEGGAAALPSLPAKGVYYDSSLTVTYWQTDPEDALN